MLSEWVQIPPSPPIISYGYPYWFQH